MNLDTLICPRCGTVNPEGRALVKCESGPIHGSALPPDWCEPCREAFARFLAEGRPDHPGDYPAAPPPRATASA